MRHLTEAMLLWDWVAALNRRTAQSGCGAVVTFVGVVRADGHESRTVRALYYEADREMAERQIQRLVTEARARWPLDAVQIRHRVGQVDVGQLSVVIVVASRRRADAYAASAFLIDGIKHQAPIWKRELYDDGSSQWVTCMEAERVVSAESFGAAHAHV